MSLKELLNSPWVKSITPFSPAMGQETKEDTMQITDTPTVTDAQMTEAQEVITQDKTVDEFLKSVTEGKSEQAPVVQTEADVGGVPA